MTFVLDSSALMALVKSEPGAEVVAASLANGVVSIVNLTETLGKAALQGRDPRVVEGLLLGPGLRVEPVEMGDVRSVARLHELARRNVSLADRFCLALAMDRGLPVLTADRPWRDLGLPIDLKMIR